MVCGRLAFFFVAVELFEINHNISSKVLSLKLKEYMEIVTVL